LRHYLLSRHGSGADFLRPDQGRTHFFRERTSCLFGRVRVCVNSRAVCVWTAWMAIPPISPPRGGNRAHQCVWDPSSARLAIRPSTPRRRVLANGNVQERRSPRSAGLNVRTSGVCGGTPRYSLLRETLCLLPRASRITTRRDRTADRKPKVPSLLSGLL